jgi:DNA mismatch endonuclease (patch repair protein)
VTVDPNDSPTIRRASSAPSSEAARRRMQATRRRDTRAEELLGDQLVDLGLDFLVDEAPIPSLRLRADILFRAQRIAVYVDGCFWHGCPIHGTWPKSNAVFWREKIETNRRRDSVTSERLAEDGWRVMRFWEHEDPTVAAREIARAVSGTTPVLTRQGLEAPATRSNPRPRP